MAMSFWVALVIENQIKKENCCFIQQKSGIGVKH